MRELLAASFMLGFPCSSMAYDSIYKKYQKLNHLLDHTLISIGSMKEVFMGFEYTGIVSAVDEKSPNRDKVSNRVYALITAGH